MTTLAQLRKAALALPEVEEGRHDGLVAFSVRGRGFASVTRAGEVELRIPAAEADDVLAQHAEGERLTRGATLLGVRLPLTAINGQQLNHWVRRAWLSRAPAALARATTAADAAGAGEVGDLPRAIGNPATRALVGAGITSLDDVAAAGLGAVGKLHGVGPRAVRILEDALRAR